MSPQPNSHVGPVHVRLSLVNHMIRVHRSLLVLLDQRGRCPVVHQDLLRVRRLASTHSRLEVEVDLLLEAEAAGVVDGTYVTKRRVHARRTLEGGEDQRAVEAVHQRAQATERGQVGFYVTGGEQSYREARRS